MADTRSKEDVLAGVLRIPIGGVEKLVPTLKLRAVRDWQQQVATALGSIKPVLAPDPTSQTIAAVASMALETVLELVLAYDTTGALGGRDWLEENADPAQLYAAVLEMGKVTFPFVDDATSMIAAFPALFLTKPGEPSSSTSSTNGHSPTGSSSRRRSRPASTRTS